MCAVHGFRCRVSLLTLIILGSFKKTSKSTNRRSKAKKLKKAIPTSGSILFNRSTLSSQKEVYNHNFKVMQKLSKKGGSKISKPGLFSKG